MVYSVDVLIAGTAYIQAESPEAAQEILDGFHLTEVGVDMPISGLQFDDPNLPEASLSPAMTLYGKFTDDIEFTEVDE